MSSWYVDEVHSPDDLASFEVLPDPGTLPNYELPEHKVNKQHLKATEDKGKLKNRVLSVWNNVKYGGWSVKSKPRLSKTSPVWMMGHVYPLGTAVERECFRQAFSSLLWLTYRKDFVPLTGSSFTSDCGWGCMIRTAQMLLGRALLLHLLPPDWRWAGAHHQSKDDLEVSLSGRLKPRQGVELVRLRWGRRRSDGSVLDVGEDRDEVAHRRVVSRFGDVPDAPFGLHRLVELGRASGRRAGDWYGPAVTAHMLRKAVSASDVDNLAVYVAQDCTVYVGDVEKLFEDSESVIILVPVRLGGETLNRAYVECVKKLLQLKSCVGVMGGKPKHSLYFVGFQDDKLIHLDPHLCQAAVDVSQEKFPLESFHCKAARRMSFHRMDPSCTLGFYAKSRSDFRNLRADVTQALMSSVEKYPIFTFVEGRGQEEEDDDDDVGEAVTSDPAPRSKDKGKRRRSAKRSGLDEFVML